ncbi:hypothetical protein FKM82_027681 [Ascaphus truei]
MWPSHCARLTLPALTVPASHLCPIQVPAIQFHWHALQLCPASRCARSHCLTPTVPGSLLCPLHCALSTVHDLSLCRFNVPALTVATPLTCRSHCARSHCARLYEPLSLCPIPLLPGSHCWPDPTCPLHVDRSPTVPGSRARPAPTLCTRSHCPPRALSLCRDPPVPALPSLCQLSLCPHRHAQSLHCARYHCAPRPFLTVARSHVQLHCPALPVPLLINPCPLQSPLCRISPVPVSCAARVPAPL